VDLMKDAPRRTTSVQWPAEVDSHLDLLVRLAAEQGVLVSRAQMLSALVANSSLDGPTVGRLVRRYLGQLQAGDLASRAPAPDALPAVRHRGRQRSQPS
jgi:hypothetical protein